MKKSILITLLLFLGVNGFGQKDRKDSIGSLWLYAETNRDGLTINYFKPDTVRAILMCADTSDLLNTPSTSGTLYLDKNGIIIQYDSKIFWRFGYAIYPLNGFVSYLDADKKPLKKSTVVFMSINR